MQGELCVGVAFELRSILRLLLFDELFLGTRALFGSFEVDDPQMRRILRERGGTGQEDSVDADLVFFRGEA